MISWDASNTAKMRTAIKDNCENGSLGSIWNWPRTKLGCSPSGALLHPHTGDWRAKRPETFEFLGFKHVCGKDRNGRFAVFRLPSLKSRRKFLTQTDQWLIEHWHWRRWEQQEHLAMQLRGFYQYFGLHHCERHLTAVRREVQRQWKHRLQRQGQRMKWSWKRLSGRSWFDLPFGGVVHPTV